MRATGLLLLVGVAFALTHFMTDGEGVWGFARAAAEAGLVGGFADWFAVTALFRHPLGIPIPHTAVIRKRKDEFGLSLGEFVARNFLDPDLVEARMADADPAARLGRWMSRQENAAIAARQAAGVVVGVVDALRDEEVQDGIRDTIEAQLESLDVATIAARIIRYGMEGGHHEVLVDAGLRGFASMVEDNRELLRRRIREESPWWMPDERVFKTIYEGLQRFVAEVTADPNHITRRQLNERALELADRLESDDELRARVELVKRRFLDHPDFRSWTAGLWDHIRASVASAAAEPESELRRRLESWAMQLGRRLETDEAMRHQFNTWIGSVVSQVLRHSGDEVTRLIGATVERWDADETSDRLELLLGRDLQYIRINGTLVGGLVGLIIHSVLLVAP